MKFLTRVLLLLFLNSVSFANTGQSTLNIFSPNNDQVDFTLVERSKTNEKKYFNTVLFFDAAYQSLAVYSNPTLDADDLMSFVHLGISYGLTEKIEIGGHFPLLFNQTLDNAQLGSSLELTGTGFTNAVGYLKYNFLKRETYGVSLLTQVGVANSESNFYIGESSGPSFSLSLLFDKSFGKWETAFNVGYLSRSSGDRGASYAFFEPIQSTINGSFGISRTISKKSKFSLEFLFNQHDFEIDTSDREKTAGEAFLSMRTQFKKLKFIFGAGVGVINGVSTPTYRGFLGLNYRFTFKKDKEMQETEEVEEEVTTPVSQEEDVEEEKEEEKGVNEEAAPEPEEPKYIEETLNIEEESVAPKFIEQTITIEEEDEVSARLEEFDEQNKGAKADFQKIILNYVEFEFNSYTLNKKSEKTLNSVAKYLETADFESFEIIGHTDFYGTTMYNELLSLRRAKSVYDYFAKRGIGKVKMKFNGYGKRRPVDTGVSEDKRQRNRRVEIILRNN